MVESYTEEKIKWILEVDGGNELAGREDGLESGIGRAEKREWNQ